MIRSMGGRLCSLMQILMPIQCLFTHPDQLNLFADYDADPLLKDLMKINDKQKIAEAIRAAIPSDSDVSIYQNSDSHARLQSRAHTLSFP